MDLKFSAVSGDDRDGLDQKPAPLGIIMLEDPEGSRWEMRRADKVSESGSGKVIGLKPGSSWINNLSFAESRGFFNQRDQQQLIRSGAWIGYEVGEILEEWGYGGLDLPKAADFMGTICGRISDVAYGFCMHMDRRLAAKRTREIYRSSSLASSLRALNERRISSFVASDREMEDHLQQAYQNGIFRVGRDKGPDDLVLEFVFPRISYAMEVSDCDVPLSGQWMRAACPKDADPNEFVSYSVNEYGHQCLFRAMHDIDMERDPAWVRAVLGLRNGVERTRFTADEIVAFATIPARVTSVMIPRSGAAKSATSVLLHDFIESFGGVDPASMSWTAGLFAENILNSSSRSGKAKAGVQTSESVWIFARDRVLMSPLLSALHDAGANIMKARGGRVTVSLPRSAENVTSAAYAAWEVGAHLTYGSADLVRKSVGCELPEDRDDWPGTDVDHMIASITHKGGRKDLWNLDGMCRLESKERLIKAGIIMSAWDKNSKGEQ